MSAMRTLEVGLGGALGLGAGRVARVVVEALGPSRSSDEDGPLLVLGDEVARALDRQHVPVRAVVGARPGRAARGLTLVERGEQGLGLAAGALGGAVIARLDGASLADVLAECAAAVRDGGLIAVASPTTGLVRKPPPPEAIAGALLHARLVDLEQREAGSTLVTLGRVRAAAR